MNLAISKEYFGELIPFIEDDKITDITWNGKDLWIDDLEKGRYKSDVKLSHQFVNSFATRIANLANKNFNMSSPLLEAETDNLRISIVDNSVTNTDRSIAIRKTPAVRRLNESGMIKEGYAQAMVIKLLETFVKGHSSIIVTGDVGSGKTELIKYLTKFIPPYERAISIEDNYELRLSSINPNLDCIEIKADLTGQFSYQNAIKAALRQLCKWLLMAEARSTEVVQLLEAASTGCIVMTTMHSDDVRKVPDRVVNMMGLAGEEKRNDVYNFFDVAIKVDIQKTDQGIKRSIDQICVIDRDNDINTLTVIYDNGFNGEKVPRNIWKKIEEGAGENKKILALFDFLKPEDAGTFEIKDTPEFAKMLEEAEEELRLEYTDPFEEIAALGDESLIPIEEFELLKEKAMNGDPDIDYIEIPEEEPVEEIPDDVLAQLAAEDDNLESTVNNLINTLFNNGEIIEELRREIQVVEDCMNRGIPIPQEELMKIYKTLGLDENGKKILNATPLPKTEKTLESTDEATPNISTAENDEISLEELIAQFDEVEKSSNEVVAEPEIIEPVAEASVEDQYLSHDLNAELQEILYDKNTPENSAIEPIESITEETAESAIETVESVVKNEDIVEPVVETIEPVIKEPIVAKPVSDAKEEIQKILAEENISSEDELEAKITKMFETRKLGSEPITQKIEEPNSVINEENLIVQVEKQPEETTSEIEDIQKKIDAILNFENSAEEKHNEIPEGLTDSDIKNEIDKTFPLKNSEVVLEETVKLENKQFELEPPLNEDADTLNVEDFYLGTEETTKRLFTDSELDEIFKNEIN